MYWFMVFNATFNNISVISWYSVLLAEETGSPGEFNVFVLNYLLYIHVCICVKVGDYIHVHPPRVETPLPQ